MNEIRGRNGRQLLPLTFDICQTDHTGFTPFGGSSPACSPSRISAGRVLYWRVKALDGTVNGVWSDVRAFMYDPAVTRHPEVTRGRGEPHRGTSAPRDGTSLTTSRAKGHDRPQRCHLLHSHGLHLQHGVRA